METKKGLYIYKNKNKQKQNIMKTTQLTNKEIATIFNSNGLYIKLVDCKGDRDHGMTFTMNKVDDVNMFHSFQLAYEYFLKMNWI